MALSDLAKKLPELIELEKAIDAISGLAQIEKICQLNYKDTEFPVHKIVLGSRDPKASVLLLTGGVHGLERIGTQVVTAILNSVCELLTWDEVISHILSQIRLVFIPLLNPVGMYLKQRSNLNGVDLMRNAPIEAEGEASFLVGGHRLSSRLPWFRGEPERPPEIETQALIDAAKTEMFQSKCVVSVDFHSGFGVVDRLWFPYAKTTKPFPHLAELHALKSLLDKTYPNHFYNIEPQAKNYTTHGDVWDYLYDEFYKVHAKDHLYMPLTLEMGSWLWVKKNPKQFFSALGPFNPVMPHRRQRILRRHNTLFEFLTRSIISPDKWAFLPPETRAFHEQKALGFWYQQKQDV